MFAACGSESPVSTQQIEPATATKSVDDATLSSRLPPQPVCKNTVPEFLMTYDELRSNTVRKIQVLLDPKYFNEQNLAQIFDCLSKANPDPEHLMIDLQTDRSRVHIPDGRPGTGASNLPPDPRENDFLRAMYFRRPGKGDRVGKEYFEYSPSVKVPRSEFKWVKIR